MPASDGSDDFVGVCDPMEGLRLGIVILEEAVDGGLEVGEHAADSHRASPPGIPTGIQMSDAIH